MVMSLVLEAGSWGTKFCLNFWLKLVAFTRFGESCLKAGYVLLAAVSPARSGSSLLEQCRQVSPVKRSKWTKHHSRPGV